MVMVALSAEVAAWGESMKQTVKRRNRLAHQHISVTAVPLLPTRLSGKFLHAGLFVKPVTAGGALCGTTLASSAEMHAGPGSHRAPLKGQQVWATQVAAVLRSPLGPPVHPFYRFSMQA